MGNVKYTNAHREQAIALAKAGKSNADIAHKMRVPEGTVKSWTVGLGTRRRSGPRARTISEVASRPRVIHAGGHEWATLTGWASR
jgi:hypothetical protein